MVRGLLERGARVTAFDPEAMENAKRTLGDRIAYADDMYDALDGASALVVCTEWHEFRRPDWDEVARRLPGRVVFDGRNLYKPERMAAMGYTYYSVGRPRLEPVTP